MSSLVVNGVMMIMRIRSKIGSLAWREARGQGFYIRGGRAFFGRSDD